VLTATGTVFATAGYVSPEQAAGEPADARSDLYSLGCVLYALLAGEPPFTAEHPLGVVQQQLTSPPPLLSSIRAGVPPELDELLATLLAKNPADRPKSAEDVRQRLSALRGGGDAPTAATIALTRAPTTRRRWPIAAAAIGLVALAAGLAATLSSGGDKTAVTTTTPPTTTAPVTTTTTTTTATTPAAPATPEQAIADIRSAIIAAQAQGALDPAAAADLNHRIDDIANALQHPNPEDAVHKTSDLLHHLADLVNGGQLTTAGLTQISTPLNQLAALLPAVPAPGNDGGHGKGKGDKEKG
jgi:serine/threonine-protein kinase